MIFTRFTSIMRTAVSSEMECGLYQHLNASENRSRSSSDKIEGRVADLPSPIFPLNLSSHMRLTQHRFQPFAQSREFSSSGYSYSASEDNEEQKNSFGSIVPPPPPSQNQRAEQKWDNNKIKTVGTLIALALGGIGFSCYKMYYQHKTQKAEGGSSITSLEGSSVNGKNVLIGHKPQVHIHSSPSSTVDENKKKTLKND